MPSLYTKRDFTSAECFHVINRGVNKANVFKDAHDMRWFVELLKRNLRRQDCALDLLAYCLMPNHFHLVFQRREMDAIPVFMQRCMTGYVRRFNRRHDRTGPLFGGPYRAIGLEDPRAIRTVIAYVHLNPVKTYDEYEFSGHRQLLTGAREDWYDPGLALTVFGGSPDYEAYLHRRRRRFEELRDGVSALWTPLA